MWASIPASRIRAAQNGATRRATRASAVNRSLAAASATRSLPSRVTMTSPSSTILAMNTCGVLPSAAVRLSILPVSR